jgi:acetolactate synthase-1/2/3 large subunit
MTRSGGRILVDQLALHGVERVFGVPGESFLPVLDALLDSQIRFVVCRHEAGAANMAEAVGKLTGRPGVSLVTRGPGATHAAVGLHTAYQDGTPLVLLIGQVARNETEREAFQELDYRRTFGRMTKWVAEVDSAARLPELVARAFATATSGRTGPVVLALPEDMLAEEAEVPDALCYRPAQASPGAHDLDRMRELVQASRRPLVVVGGQPWSEQAHAQLAAWCEASRLPVAGAWRCQDYVDNLSPSFAGHLGLAADPQLVRRLRDADMLLLVGTRLGDIETSGFRTFIPPATDKTFVHVHPSPEELGRVYQPTLPIVASGPAFAAALAGVEPLDGAVWAEWTVQAHTQFVENMAGRELPGALRLTDVMEHLRTRLPHDALLTNGAGNFAIWAHRFYAFRTYRTQLAPASGAMGYGLPAAIAAKLVHPERIVVCFTGDGDFQMSGQELATAVQEGAPIVVLVVDNGMYGTIRMHQERQYPGRPSGTDLRNPDFAALARAYGAHGERVERSEDFAAAFERALAAGVPAVLQLVVDPEAVTPRQTLAEIRAAAEGNVR